MAYAMNTIDWYRQNRVGLVGFGGFNGFGAAGSDSLGLNEGIGDGECIISSDGRFASCVSGGNWYIHKHADPGLAIVKILAGGGGHSLFLMPDGHVKFWKSPGYGQLWMSGGTGNKLVMQSDGNLVLYDSAGVARWSSGTAGTSAPYPQAAAPAAAPSQPPPPPPPSQPAGPSAADVYKAAAPDAERARQAGLAPNHSPDAYTDAVEAVTLFNGPMLAHAQAGDVAATTADAARIRQLADSAEAANRSYVQPPPTGWAKLADEYGTVTLPAPGGWPVQYGANGKFIAKSVTGSAPCSNDYFSDPIYGTVKACYVDAATQAAMAAAMVTTEAEVPSGPVPTPMPTSTPGPVYQPSPTTILVGQPMAPATAGISSSTILLVGAGLAALFLLKK